MVEQTSMEELFDRRSEPDLDDEEEYEVKFD